MQERRLTYERSTHTRVAVSFHTDEPGGFTVERPVVSHPRLGVIIGATTGKEIGSASGDFTITVKKDRIALGARSAVRDLWRDPESVWVRIKWIVDGQVIDGTWGQIDSIKENTSRAGAGARTETYTITGRDFGKIFETTDLFVNFHHNPDKPIRSYGALMAAMIDNLIGTPAHFIRVLLEEWVGNNGAAETQWELPRSLGGGSAYRKLDLNGIEDMKDSVNGRAVSPSLFQMDQSGAKLWDSMQELSNPVMNELFVDLAAPRGDLEFQAPTVFLRERPFPTRSDDGRTSSEHKWEGLVTHELAPGDVGVRDIAKGGASTRFNYWQLQLQGIASEGFNTDEILQRGVDGVPPGHPGNIPIWEDGSIRRNGLRRYQATTRFIPFYAQQPGTQDDQANFFQLAARWLKKLHDWYVIAPFELSGTITTTRVLPEIRIGHRVRERRAGGTITYYVEGVHHSYNYGQAGRSNLTLTRGEYEDDDLLAYAYDQYQAPRVLTGAEQCFESLGTEITLDESAESFDELGLYDEDCEFISPSRDAMIGRVFTPDRRRGSVGEDDFSAVTGEGRVLESERDGNARRLPSPDSQISARRTALDDSEPRVGDIERIPPAAEVADRRRRPGEPSIDRQSLERAEPIDADDPIGGLGLTGHER